MTLGNRIREIRKSMKMTQQEFADFIGINQQVLLSYYESDTKKPTTETIIKIAEKCNVSTDWLLGLVPVKKNELLKILVEEYWLYKKNLKYTKSKMKKICDVYHFSIQEDKDSIFINGIDGECIFCIRNNGNTSHKST